MGRSCEKCWDFPCTCGHDYERMTVERLEQQIILLQRVVARKKGLDPDRNKPIWDTSRPGNW